jgi:NADPH:quinone reductase-like Zn-dependent oxidoreductase
LASKGAHVVGVCSERNADFVRSCGAKEVCTRESGGLATYRGETNDKLPLDYVLDCVGGDAVEEQASKALRRLGHFVTVVGPGEGSFGDSDSSAGIGRGAAIAARTLKSKFGGAYSYTLASMSPFGLGKKIANIAEVINKSTSDKGPALMTRTVPANDMIAVRSALDSVAKHESGGRVILDFSVLSE